MDLQPKKNNATQKSEWKTPNADDRTKILNENPALRIYFLYHEILDFQAA